MLSNAWFRTGALLLIAGLVWTGLHAYSLGTWLLEVLPVLIVLPLLWLTRRHFPLTALLYALIFVHAIILMVGGEYTYARVPFGFWIEHALHLQRNPYDRIGHFAQGFVPAIAAREILMRGGYVRTRAMQAFLVVCVVLAVSATYEMIEWATALAFGQGADDFLGTQGDPFDTQADMFTALLGALAALLLSGLHDLAIRRLPPNLLWGGQVRRTPESGTKPLL